MSVSQGDDNEGPPIAILKSGQSNISKSREPNSAMPRGPVPALHAVPVKVIQFTK